VVNKTYIAFAYCFAFLFVYLVFLAYSIVPAVVADWMQVDNPLPTNAYANASAMYAVGYLGSAGSLASWSPVVIVLFIGLVIFSYFMSMRCMSMGM